MNSITVKWLLPTNTKGYRVVASTISGIRLTLNWDYSISGHENSDRAALALASKLGWNKGKSITLVRGYCTNHQYVYSVVDGSETITLDAEGGWVA